MHFFLDVLAVALLGLRLGETLGIKGRRKMFTLNKDLSIVDGIIFWTKQQSLISSNRYT